MLEDRVHPHTDLIEPKLSVLESFGPVGVLVYKPVVIRAVAAYLRIPATQVRQELSNGFTLRELARHHHRSVAVLRALMRRLRARIGQLVY